MGRLLLRLASALLALCSIGCTCAHEDAHDESRLPSAEPESSEVDSPEPPRVERWPDAVIELSSRPPATRIVVRPGSLTIDNRELVQTWPVAALERARENPEPSHPAWPRIDRVVPLDDERALGAALAAARRAERAATGAGSGLGICDLRVAADVAFDEFERALRATGLAGYRSPRILLGPDDALLVFEWPRAASGEAPSEAQIREALAAIERGDDPSLADPGASDARVRLTDGGARVFHRGERRCEGVGASGVAACLRGMLATRVTIEVAADLSFGEVVPWVQQASLASDGLRVRALR